MNLPPSNAKNRRIHDRKGGMRHFLLASEICLRLHFDSVYFRSKTKTAKCLMEMILLRATTNYRQSLRIATQTIPKQVRQL